MHLTLLSVVTLAMLSCDLHLGKRILPRLFDWRRGRFCLFSGRLHDDRRSSLINRKAFKIGNAYIVAICGPVLNDLNSWETEVNHYSGENSGFREDLEEK